MFKLALAHICLSETKVFYTVMNMCMCLHAPVALCKYLIPRCMLAQFLLSDLFPSLAGVWSAAVDCNLQIAK